MSSALIQAGLNSSTTAVALIVLVLAVGLMVFLFARSSAQRREREARVRDRMLEMEREAQFGAAASQVPMSRNPGAIARQITNLLREHMSLRVLAIYAGSAADAALVNVLAEADSEGSDAWNSGLPASVSASLLAEHARPAVVSIAQLAGFSLSNRAVAEGPPAEVTEEPTAEGAEEPPIAPPTAEAVVEPADLFAGDLVVDKASDESQNSIASDRQSPATRAIETVMLLPWRGPFEWSGFIVTAPLASSLEEHDTYHEPLARLTDVLAVALDCQHSDALGEAERQHAARITEFSRSLVSSREAASPLDAIVGESRRLVGSDSASLWRVEEASGMVRMVAAHGLTAQDFLPLPVGQGLAGSIARSGEVLATEDAPSDSRCIFPREALENGIISYLGAPLSVDGRVLGVIDVHCATRRAWTENEQRLLESAAAIIAELIKSTDSRGNRIRVESAYLGLSESLQRLRSDEEVKEAAVEVLGHALGASRVIVVDFNDQDHPEPVKHEYRQTDAKSALGAVVGKGLFSEAASSVSGQPIAVSDSKERSLAGAETATALGVLSEIAVPVRVDDRTAAIVYVHQCDRVREWEPDEIEFAERVVRQLSLSLSNLRSLEAASKDAQQARAEAERALEISSAAPARIRELEDKLAEIEGQLSLSRSAESEARGLLSTASAVGSTARAEADISHRAESEVRQQLERLQEEHKQAQGSAQQLLEINRLKSEFIVNAGHEMEASLQSVLGLAELLERGSYGALAPDQHEAVRSIYGWARRLKSDIDWLVEYGSARSRRLEPSES